MRTAIEYESTALDVGGFPVFTALYKEHRSHNNESRREPNRKPRGKL
jgi:hypothetical protein